MLCKDMNSCWQRLLLAGVLAIGKNQGVLLHHSLTAAILPLILLNLEEELLFILFFFTQTIMYIE